MDIKKFVLSNLLLIVLALLLVLTLLFLGFNIWFFLVAILYVLFYLIFISKTLTFEFIKLSYQWFALGFIVLLSFVILFAVNPKGKNSSNSSSALTPKQCEPIYEKYNEKIVDITGDNLKGSMAIKIDPDNCEANVYYNFLVTVSLDKNYSIPNSGYSEYYYAAYIQKPGETSVYGTTSLQPAFTNTSSLPSDLFSYGSDYDNRRVVEGESSNVFYNSWMSTFYFNDESYEKILERTTYGIVNSAPYAVVEEIDEYSKNYSVDSDKACEEGESLKTIQLTYTER